MEYKAQQIINKCNQFLKKINELQEKIGKHTDLIQYLQEKINILNKKFNSFNIRFVSCEKNQNLNNTLKDLKVLGLDILDSEKILDSLTEKFNLFLTEENLNFFKDCNTQLNTASLEDNKIDYSDNDKQQKQHISYNFGVFFNNENLDKYNKNIRPIIRDLLEEKEHIVSSNKESSSSIALLKAKIKILKDLKSEFQNEKNELKDITNPNGDQEKRTNKLYEVKKELHFTKKKLEEKESNLIKPNEEQEQIDRIKTDLISLYDTIKNLQEAYKTYSSIKNLHDNEFSTCKKNFDDLKEEVDKSIKNINSQSQNIDNLTNNNTKKNKKQKTKNKKYNSDKATIENISDNNAKKEEEISLRENLLATADKKIAKVLQDPLQSLQKCPSNIIEDYKNIIQSYMEDYLLYKAIYKIIQEQNIPIKNIDQYSKEINDISQYFEKNNTIFDEKYIKKITKGNPRDNKSEERRKIAVNKKKYKNHTTAQLENEIKIIVERIKSHKDKMIQIDEKASSPLIKQLNAIQRIPKSIKSEISIDEVCSMPKEPKDLITSLNDPHTQNIIKTYDKLKNTSISSQNLKSFTQDINRILYSLKFQSNSTIDENSEVPKECPSLQVNNPKIDELNKDITYIVYMIDTTINELFITANTKPQVSPHSQVNNAENAINDTPSPLNYFISLYKKSLKNSEYKNSLKNPGDQINKKLSLLNLIEIAYAYIAYTNKNNIYSHLILNIIIKINNLKTKYETFQSECDTIIQGLKEEFEKLRNIQKDLQEETKKLNEILLNSLDQDTLEEINKLADDNNIDNKLLQKVENIKVKEDPTLQQTYSQINELNNTKKDVNKLLDKTKKDVNKLLDKTKDDLLTIILDKPSTAKSSEVQEEVTKNKEISSLMDNITKEMSNLTIASIDKTQEGPSSQVSNAEITQHSHTKSLPNPFNKLF